MLTTRTRVSERVYVIGIAALIVLFPPLSPPPPPPPFGPADHFRRLMLGLARRTSQLDFSCTNATLVSAYMWG